VRGALITAVTGNAQNGGQPNTIFKINTSTGQVTAMGTTPVTPNSFAFDPDNDLYYFGNHANDDLYYFDPTTGTSTKMADAVADFGAPNGSRFSGPGDFYNGRYYFIPESSSGQPFNAMDDVYWVELSADGRSWVSSGIITVTMPGTLTGFGDFGDIAIDPTTGVLYGQTVARNSSQVGGLFSIDIGSATPSLTLIDTSPGATTNAIQLAFNEDGELFGDRYDNIAEILPIDKVTGIINAPIALVGTTADFFDLGSVTSTAPSLEETPEPASLHLAAVGLLLAAGGWWRRRRSAPAVTPTSREVTVASGL
jgi:MYXO-CTERM domain-containing protein